MSDTFAESVSARSARLLRTAFLLTHEWAMAEDLLQTSLVKAWSAWRRIEHDPEPCVRRILVNTYATWWRRWTGERPTAVLPESAVDDKHMSGMRLVHSVTAAVEGRMAMLSWTPPTLDFEVVYRCFGVPGRVSVRGQLTVNGRILADTGCESSFTLRFSDLARQARADIRAGEPMTLDFTLDPATASNDGERPVPLPTEGTIAAAVYVPVPFTEYPFPSRPARLGPLSAWTNCPPEQSMISEPADGLAPVTLHTIWRDHLLIRIQTLTPRLPAPRRRRHRDRQAGVVGLRQPQPGQGVGHHLAV